MIQNNTANSPKEAMPEGTRGLGWTVLILFSDGDKITLVGKKIKENPI